MTRALAIPAWRRGRELAKFSGEDSALRLALESLVRQEYDGAMARRAGFLADESAEPRRELERLEKYMAARGEGMSVMGRKWHEYQITALRARMKRDADVRAAALDASLERGAF